MNDNLLKNANIQDIAEKGSKIYEDVKSQFGEADHGKFLAIDIDTKDFYKADTSSEAVELARKAHPDKVFYVVKIGFAVSEILASLSR